MGRTLPSITQTFLLEQEAFLRFRRALRRSDQIALDDLFVSAQKHLAAAAYAAHALPLEVFMLSMLLEEHKEVQRLRRQLDEMTGTAPLAEPATTVPLSGESAEDELTATNSAGEAVRCPSLSRADLASVHARQRSRSDTGAGSANEGFVDNSEVIDADPDPS